MGREDKDYLNFFLCYVFIVIEDFLVLIKRKIG